MAFVGLKNFVHTQSVPSTAWAIYHAFREQPSVDIAVNYQGGLEKAFPLAVTHVDEDNILITWSSEQTGAVMLSSSFPLPTVDVLPTREPKRTPHPPGSAQNFDFTISEVYDAVGAITIANGSPALAEISTSIGVLEIRAVSSTYINDTQYQVGLYADDVRVKTMTLVGNYNLTAEVNAPSATSTVVYTTKLENLDNSEVTVTADATYQEGSITIGWNAGVIIMNITVTEAQNLTTSEIYPGPYVPSVSWNDNVELHIETSEDLDPLVYQLGVYANGVRDLAAVPDGLRYNTYVVLSPVVNSEIIYTVKLEYVVDNSLVPNSAVIISTEGTITINWENV